jgi:chromosome segregation ATPase
MKKINFFERPKSQETSDSAEVKGLEEKMEPVEVEEEEPEEFWVEADENEFQEDFTEKDVFENLGQLRRELKEFEKLGEGIRATISSIERLVPRLKESKERLEKDIYTKRNGVEHLTQKIPELNRLKEELLQSIELKQDQKKLLENDIDERQKEVELLTKEVPKLKEQERDLLRRIQQNQEDLTRINDQIEEIVSIQEYGIDFVSALVFASQKSKQ